MISHVALCRRNREPGWLVMIKDEEGGGWSVASVSSLRSLAATFDEALRLLSRNPVADFSFSMRTAFAVIDLPAEEMPKPARLKTALPRVSIAILLPEHDGSDRWASIWRDPRGGLSTRGKSSLFMVATLQDQIQKWLAFYGPARIEKGQIGQLELWVRRTWAADALLPDDFPPPKHIKRAPEPELGATP